MIEKIFSGSRSFYMWIAFLLLVIGFGLYLYSIQLQVGLKVTGLSRDVSWGFYIAQFTYLVGVAASAVMLVLPSYFHNYKKFSKMIILGEFMAIGAVIMCMIFIVVDMGQPQRVLNVILHPTPNSIMFWDMTVLTGYLVLNLIIGWTTLEAEWRDTEPPKWIKPLIYLSIFWAISIHTVTAFLYSGLPGRHYWFNSILAGRFLASAFCSGPAILLLLSMLLKKLVNYDVGKEAKKTLTIIITYAMGINIFFYLLELFTAIYGGVPGHEHPFGVLFFGLHGQSIWLNKWMWATAVLALVSFALLLIPSTRNSEKLLPYTLIILVIATWVDKGLSFIFAGFAPNPFDELTNYAPSPMELGISLGILAIGALVVSLLWKIALEVKKEAGTY